MAGVSNSVSHKLYIITRNASFTCLTPALQRNCISQNPEMKESLKKTKNIELSFLPIARGDSITKQRSVLVLLLANNRHIFCNSVIGEVQNCL